MSKHLRLLTVVGIVAVLSLAPTVPVMGQRLGQRSEGTFPVIVVFNDNAGFQRFSGRYLPDDRAGANPAGWDYLDFGVAGAVQALEAQGYDGWYVLEQDTVLEGDPPPGSGPIEAAAASLAFLKDVE